MVTAPVMQATAYTASVRRPESYTAPVEREEELDVPINSELPKNEKRRFGKIFAAAGVLAIIALLVMLLIPSAPPADVPSADVPA